MKKKNYKMPTVQSVCLQQLRPLLTTSGNANMNVEYDEEDW